LLACFSFGIPVVPNSLVFLAVAFLGFATMCEAEFRTIVLALECFVQFCICNNLTTTCDESVLVAGAPSSPVVLFFVNSSRV
jgi:hypothetical protein